jgi:hypothetical protein
MNALKSDVYAPPVIASNATPLAPSAIDLTSLLAALENLLHRDMQTSTEETRNDIVSGLRETQALLETTLTAAPRAFGYS